VELLCNIACYSTVSLKNEITCGPCASVICALPRVFKRQINMQKNHGARMRATGRQIPARGGVHSPASGASRRPPPHPAAAGPAEAAACMAIERPGAGRQKPWRRVRYAGFRRRPRDYCLRGGVGPKAAVKRRSDNVYFAIPRRLLRHLRTMRPSAIVRFPCRLCGRCRRAGC